MAEKQKNGNSPSAQKPAHPHASPRQTEAAAPSQDRDPLRHGNEEASAQMGSAGLGRKIAGFKVSADEEVDALRLNMAPDARGRDTRNGTGKIVDDLAAEHIVAMTEAGPELTDRGVASVVPGRNDTSAVLRRHQLNHAARPGYVVEGNLDEPRDESNAA